MGATFFFSLTLFCVQIEDVRTYEDEDEDELLGMDTNPTNHTRSAGASTHPLPADASLLATGSVAVVSRPTSPLRSHHASPTGEDPHDSHDAARRARRAP